MTMQPSPQSRAAYRYLRAISTRWMDNDIYGHINNVTYYSYFDTIVNGYLIEQGALDIAHGPVIGLVVETHCNYFKPIAFPDAITGALRVAHRGTSSVRYEIGIFRGDDDLACAQGHFVHVYVDRASRKAVSALPDQLREALATLSAG